MRCALLRQGPVGVASVVEPQDYDLSTVMVDPVQDPVGAAPGRPDPIKVFAERLADSMRVVQQCRRDEVDDGGRDGLRQFVSYRASSRGREDDLIGRVGHGRSWRTASTPRTTSPRA